MIKDIEIKEVLDIGLALIPEKDPQHGTLWDVYLVNLREEPITNVLISVSGRGDVNGRAKETSTIRYFHQEIAPLSSAHIEVLMPDVASVVNRYWLSFQHANYLFDKKYEVPADLNSEEADLLIPVLGKIGVWVE
jgi:hypothetical protein